MGYDRFFRFARAELNRRLIDRLRVGPLDHAVRADGGVEYRSGDEERFEDILSQVRGGIFPDWQVLSFPPGWAARYRAALAARSVEYEEEINNGDVEFLLAGHHEPHAWKVG
jgi:hypothetical protein